MNKGYRIFVILMLCLSFLIGCSQTAETEESVYSAAEVSEDGEESSEEKSRIQETFSYPNDGQEGKVYHWVVMQRGRSSIGEKEIDAINERLLALKAQAQLQLHILKVDGYVTPQLIEEANTLLEGNMDFISISPALMAFSKEEIESTFVDLSDELKNGALTEFYQTIPESVWSANQIAGGIYSFSNAKEILNHGFVFYRQVIDEIGVDSLLQLQDARGVENEEIWKNLYELKGGPVCAWTGLNWGYPSPDAETPYSRSILDNITNGWADQYFALLTDDIRYNYQTDEFEWMGESETYKSLLEKVMAFYQKGYIREPDMLTITNDGIDSEVGRVFYGNTAEVVQKEETVWIPSWKQQRAAPRRNHKYVHSFVFKEAEEDWKSVLNILGKDEEITKLLNSKYDMTLSALLYDNIEANSMTSVVHEDWYSQLEEAYAAMEENPAEGFIFNPEPIEALWEKYNQTASKVAMDGNMNIFEPAEVTLEDGKKHPYNRFSIDRLSEFWDRYCSVMKEIEIEKIVEEVNRQYKEWNS